MTPSGEAPGRGWFITIEGPEGAGKTTHAARLEAHLREAGVGVVGTREPGGTALGERIRDLLLEVAGSHDDAGRRVHDPLADALLFNAARRQLVEEVIRPALRDGTTVVCARFADSTVAYQGYGAGLPIDDLRALEVVATSGLRPDLTVLLDLPPEVGLRRKGPDDQTRFELSFDLEFHRRVRAGFLDLAAREPERFIVVDATASPNHAWEEVRQAVDRLVGIGGGDAADEPERAAPRIIG
ncbi:MAG: dTMP kinase [Chloroflexota bacterium]